MPASLTRRCRSLLATSRLITAIPSTRRPQHESNDPLFCDLRWPRLLPRPLKPGAHGEVNGQGIHQGLHDVSLFGSRPDRRPCPDSIPTFASMASPPSGRKEMEGGGAVERATCKCSSCPRSAGKVWAAIEKTTGKSFIYFNHVVKFRDVGMRGPWTSGGMEANYGIMGHTPNCFSPVDYLARRNPDGSASCTSACSTC